MLQANSWSFIKAQCCRLTADISLKHNISLILQANSQHFIKSTILEAKSQHFIKARCYRRTANTSSYPLFFAYIHIFCFLFVNKYLFYVVASFIQSCFPFLALFHFDWAVSIFCYLIEQYRFLLFDCKAWMFNMMYSIQFLHWTFYGVLVEFYPRLIICECSSLIYLSHAHLHFSLHNFLTYL